MTYIPNLPDYVPMLPWFGVVLIGMFAAPYLKQWAKQAQPLVSNKAGKALALAGRHSLLIYMAHQPILMGLLIVYLKVTA
jgi:uncharacterized membrane protein